MSIDDVDRQWMKSIKNYATNRDNLVPPQGRFNAGQKQFYWIMYYGTIFLLISGLVMWFPELLPARLQLGTRNCDTNSRTRRAGYDWRLHHSRLYGSVHGSGRLSWNGIGPCIQALGAIPPSSLVRKGDRQSAWPQMNQSPWKRRIERATGLLTVFPEAGELLRFYCRLSSFQESLFVSLQTSGRTDLTAVAKHVPALCALFQSREHPHACGSLKPIAG